MNTEIKKYIDKQKSPRKEILEKIRKIVLDIAPQAEECMSYGVPAFRLKNGLFLYASFKTHIGVYPEPAIIEVFKNELGDYETSKGTIKFGLDKEMPYALIKRIVKYKNK